MKPHHIRTIVQKVNNKITINNRLNATNEKQKMEV